MGRLHVLNGVDGLDGLSHGRLHPPLKVALDLAVFVCLFHQVLHGVAGDLPHVGDVFRCGQHAVLRNPFIHAGVGDLLGDARRLAARVDRRDGVGVGRLEPARDVAQGRAGKGMVRVEAADLARKHGILLELGVGEKRRLHGIGKALRLRTSVAEARQALDPLPEVRLLDGSRRVREVVVTCFEPGERCCCDVHGFSSCSSFCSSCIHAPGRNVTGCRAEFHVNRRSLPGGLEERCGNAGAQGVVLVLLLLEVAPDA